MEINPRSSETRKAMSDEGIRINAYIGSCSISSMGKRKIVLDVPEDQAVQFMAAQTLYGKFCEFSVKEKRDGELQ